MTPAPVATSTANSNSDRPLIHILYYMHTFTQMSDKGCVLMHAMLLVGTKTREMEIAVIMHCTRNCRWRHAIVATNVSLRTKTRVIRR